jgi:hypothetical protein
MADLRRACLMLLDVAEQQFGSQVSLSELGVDYYWNLDVHAAFDMAGQPGQHVDCGQVSDDLAELTGLLRRAPDEVVALWHDLQHLSGLLRLLAYLDLPDVAK